MALLLALDVGNTNTVLGFFEGDVLVKTARLTTVRERTADEHALFLRAVIEGKGRRVDEVDDVIVSSVVPPQDFPIRAAGRDLFGIDPLFVAPGVKTGMRILYDHPAEVGADRIVNAVAAVAAHGAPCIVVDFGTATTFDVVTASGDYLGGVICPGPASAPTPSSRAPRASRASTSTAPTASSARTRRRASSRASSGASSRRPRGSSPASAPSSGSRG